MREAHNCCFGDSRMCHQGAFNFCCSHTMPGHINHVIYTTRDPIVSILISFTSISCKILAIERGEMRDDIEALAIPVISSFERPILSLATIGKVPKEGGVRFQRRIDAMHAAINDLYEFRVFGR